MGPPSRVNRLVFQDMLCYDAKRGPHSTGVAMVSRRNMHLDKQLLLPWEFIRREEFQNQLKKNWPLLMGHNRWATIGDVTVHNAHPFHVGDVVMMHNGTLDRLSKWRRHKEFDTDTELLAHEIADHGIAPIWKELEGAATIVWWDQTEGCLKVISNGKRPFCFAFSKDGRTLIYSSEEWMFRLAAEARGLELEKHFYHLTSNQLYCFKTQGQGKIVKEATRLEHFPEITTYFPTKAHGNSGATRSAKNRSTVTAADCHGPAPHGATRAMMSCEDFFANFPKDTSECALCHGEPQWYNSVMVDGDTLVCGDCVDTAFKIDANVI